MININRLLLSYLVACSATSTALVVAEAAPVNVSSPDGTIKVDLTDDGGQLSYRVSVDNQQVVAPSKLGILSDDIEFGRNATLGKAKFSKVNETYRYFGAHAEAVNRARLATIPVTSQNQSYQVDVHVANDGVAVRLVLPAKVGRKVQADRSTWRLEGDPTVWATKSASYESTYMTTTLSKLGTEVYGLPLTAQEGNVYVALSEAALTEYGDLAVKPAADGSLEGFLYADPQGWSTDAAVIQPWRVTMIARNLTDLVNSTLIQNLNPPADPSLANADWIRPGRSIWQWMAIGAPKWDDQRQWVDWTKQMGYEYYLVDEGWEKWPNSWESLASVCTYAKTQGVNVWLWVHSRQVKSPEARMDYFHKAVEAGVVGIKIDFPPAGDHWWTTWYHDTARDAAALKLMVDFHGATKPSGMERTWPNVLAYEAVRGHEWQMTRYKRILDPAHDTILPFTRYLIGPADYTPTVFDPHELQGNTWGHELAQAILFSAPFLCTSGHPRDYVTNPARDVLSAIPAVWDETRVLTGSEPGKVAALARRRGNQWFVGIINGGTETSLDIPCDFLGKGVWQATRLGDVAGKPDAWNRTDDTAKASDHLHLTLGPKGGFVGWFRR